MSLKLPLYCAAALMVSFSASAGEFEYGANSQFIGMYGYSNGNNNYKTNNDHNQYIGDIQINTYAEYDFLNGHKTGLYADFYAAIERDFADYNQGDWGEEVYGIWDNPYGRLMLGQTQNVAAQFHSGAPSVGPLGIESSNVVDFIANPNWNRDGGNAYFNTLNTTYINTDGVAPKISYITPEYYGTMLGITYVPETFNRSGLVSKAADYYDKGGYILGLYNYQDFTIFNMTTTLGYADFTDNDQEYSASLTLSRGNWTLGGGWRMTEADDSTPLTTDLATAAFTDGYRDAYAWDVGISYEFGPFETSLSYFETKSKNTNSKDEIIVFANQYQINKNLSVSASLAQANYRTDDEGTTKGYAVVGGFTFNF